MVQMSNDAQRKHRMNVSNMLNNLAKQAVTFQNNEEINIDDIGDEDTRVANQYDDDIDEANQNQELDDSEPEENDATLNKSSSSTTTTTTTRGGNGTAGNTGRDEQADGVDNMNAPPPSLLPDDIALLAAEAASSVINSTSEKDEKDKDDDKDKDKGEAAISSEDVQKYSLELLKAVNAKNTVENVEDTVKLGEAGWQTRYYTEKFGRDGIRLTDEFYKNIATCYIEGLRWVMLYYYSGVPSWEWYFPYHFAPCAFTIMQFSYENTPFKQGKPFRPLDQLMAVQPPGCAYLLPEAMRDLMTNPNSPICDFYPKRVSECECE